MTTIRRIRRAGLAASTALLLAACGGGGSGVALDPNAPPASAGGSSQGFLAFIAGLSNSDTSDPFDLSSFDAPSNDTETQSPVPTSIDQ